MKFLTFLNVFQASRSGSIFRIQTQSINKYVSETRPRSEDTLTSILRLTWNGQEAAPRSEDTLTSILGLTWNGQEAAPGSEATWYLRISILK